MTAATLDPEILLENLVWMRRLALHLLKDESRADDVVQEVCVAALEHPPRDPSRVRNWFLKVLYNAVHKNKQGMVRQRRLVEELAARRLAAEEVSPGEQLRATRAVLEHLSKLPEKHQRVLLLCFVDGLTSAEAAAELGVPPSTLRSQKKRAQERLAERIRHSGSDLGAFCFAILGLKPPARLPFGTPTPAPKPLPFDWAATPKIGAATLAAAAVVFAGRGLLPSRPAVAPTTEPEQTAARAVAGEPGPAPMEHVAAPVRSGMPAPTPRPAPPVTSPSDGRVEFAVRAYTPGGEPLLEATQLPRSAFHVVASSEKPPQRLRKMHGGQFSNSFGVGRSLRVSGANAPLDHLYDLLLETRRDFHLSLLLGEQILTDRIVPRDTLKLEPFIVDPALVDRTLARVRLRVYDRVANEVPREARILFTSAGAKPAMQLVQAVQLDEEGGFVLERCPPGPCSVHVTLDGREHRMRHARLDAGGDYDLGTFALGPPPRITGRLLDETGTGIENGLVLVVPREAIDGRWGCPAPIYLPSGADGRFETARLPSGPFVLVAAGESGEIDSSEPALADTTASLHADVTVVRSARRGMLSLRGRFPELETHRIVLRALPSGLPVHATTGAGEFQTSLELAAGEYAVEVDDGVSFFARRTVVVAEGKDAGLDLTP